MAVAASACGRLRFDPLERGPDSGGGEGDADPTVSPAGSFAVFSSTRLGGAGGFDFYEAERLGVRFGSATLVPELTSLVIEGPSFLSPDLCRLYFTSDRSGVAKIYVAAR